MSDQTFLLLFAFFAFTLLAYLYFRKKKRLASKREALRKILLGSGAAGREFYGVDSASAIGISEHQRQIAFLVDGEQKASVHSFEDIVSAEISEDGLTIVKSSSSRSIGGAVVGGALFGAVGAVVGGLGGPSTGRQFRDVRSIDVVITLANMERPRFSIRVFDAPHGARAETEEYRSARIDAEKLMGVLNAAIEIADRDARAGKAFGGNN